MQFCPPHEAAPQWGCQEVLECGRWNIALLKLENQSSHIQSVVGPSTVVMDVFLWNVGLWRGLGQILKGPSGLQLISWQEDHVLN